MSNIICDKFRSNNTINPLTGKKISIDGFIYKLLVGSCEKPDICDDLKGSPNKNPLTSRNLVEGSKIKMFFEDFCRKQSLLSRDSKTKQSLAFRGQEPCTIYPNFTLKQHQIKTIEHMKKFDRLLLFHSVGSGKTATSITTIRCLLDWGKEVNINKEQRVFVITPTSLVQNYKKEMDKLNVDFGNRVEINSYGTFLNKYKSKVRQFQNAIFIIDEAHNFKTHVKNGKLGMEAEGVRAHDLMKLTEGAGKVILLTATPVQNNIDDFANLYAILKNQEAQLLEDPGKYYGNFSRNWSELDYTNIISIYANIERGDYPRMNEHIIEFEMTDQYYRIYKRIEETEEDKFLGKNLKVFYNGIRRAVNRVDDTVPTPKIEWTINKIRENIKNNRKTLVYSNWLESGVRIVQKRLDDLNILWGEISGSISPKTRGSIVEKYNRGDIKVLFVTAAGAEGLDLKATRSIIIIEPHWNNERIKQIIGRGVRYRSHAELPIEERVVDVYRLILKKPKGKMKLRNEMQSADEFMMELSERKEKDINVLYKKLLEYNILK